MGFWQRFGDPDFMVYEFNFLQAIFREEHATIKVVSSIIDELHSFGFPLIAFAIALLQIGEMDFLEFEDKSEYGKIFAKQSADAKQNILLHVLLEIRFGSISEMCKYIDAFIDAFTYNAEARFSFEVGKKTLETLAKNYVNHIFKEMIKCAELGELGTATGTIQNHKMTCQHQFDGEAEDPELLGLYDKLIMVSKITQMHDFNSKLRAMIWHPFSTTAQLTEIGTTGIMVPVSLLTHEVIHYARRCFIFHGGVERFNIKEIGDVHETCMKQIGLLLNLLLREYRARSSNELTLYIRSKISASFLAEEWSEEHVTRAHLLVRYLFMASRDLSPECMYNELAGQIHPNGYFTQFEDGEDQMMKQFRRPLLGENEVAQSLAWWANEQGVTDALNGKVKRLLSKLMSAGSPLFVEARSKRLGREKAEVTAIKEEDLKESDLILAFFDNPRSIRFLVTESDEGGEYHYTVILSEFWNMLP